MTHKQDIQDLISTYSLSVSLFDWEGAVSTFAPDGIWEIPAFAIFARGTEEIRGAIIGIAAEAEFLAQVPAPAIIAVDGDRATARSLVRECAGSSRRPKALEVLGIYHDVAERTAQGWRFAQRRFEMISMHEYVTAPVPAPLEG